MSRLAEVQAKYLNKEVRDKDGVRAVVTAVRQVGKQIPGEVLPLQIELNGRVKIAFRDFENQRKFLVIE